MFYLCKESIPRTSAGSAIVNTASINSKIPSPNLLAYATTKGAIADFTAGLAQMVAKQGIRVNCVAPGPIWTPLHPLYDARGSGQVFRPEHAARPRRATGGACTGLRAARFIRGQLYDGSANTGDRRAANVVGRRFNKDGRSMAAEEAFDLQRFVAAQQAVYAQVLDELTAGRKRSHWMWFVFPQLRGLGHSPTAQFYGLASLDEAKAYLRHPVLGARLVECTERVDRGLRAERSLLIFGSPDDLKFHSCLTLFAAAVPVTQPSGQRSSHISRASRTRGRGHCSPSRFVQRHALFGLHVVQQRRARCDATALRPLARRAYLEPSARVVCAPHLVPFKVSIRAPRERNAGEPRG